jgi:hypothetical protein
MRNPSVLACAVVVAIAGCHAPKTYVGVRGGEVHDHLAAMRIDGQAQLATVIVTPGKPPAPADTETVFLGQTVSVGGMTASIDSLATGCTGGAEDTAEVCALAKYRDTALKLRELERAPKGEAKHGNGTVIAFTGLALASLGGSIYCLAECKSDKGLKSAGLGLGALIFATIAYVAGGGTIRD